MTSMLFLNIPLIFISSLGILFNGYVVTAVLLTRQVSTANNILLLHLGTIDLVLGILFLTFSVPNGYGFNKHDGAISYWMSEGFSCSLHGFLHTLLHPLALWTVCGLNCDRYYAIAAPLHYAHIVNAKKVLLGLGTGWLLSLLLCLPPLFAVAPYRYVHALGACAPNFLISDATTSAGTFWYSALYTAFTLLLPTTLIICCNIKILMIARYHRHRIASAIYEVTLSAQVTITHQRNPFFVPTVTAPSSGGPPSSKFRGRSAISSVLQLLGSLLTLYTPHYTLILWQSAKSSFLPPKTTIPPHLLTASLVLLACSPTLNGFLYGVKNKNLRKTFQNYWRKKQTKSEVQQEIQARTPSTCGSRRPSLTLQRRLSEACLGPSPQKHKMKRISTELSWRPASAASLTLSLLAGKNGTSAPTPSSIKQTTSCNTLQVPSAADGPRPGPSSPRITITRTYSDESSDTSRKEPSSVITRKHSSSSSALIERGWRARLAAAAPAATNDSGESSSDLSDESGKIFMALDSQKVVCAGENEILLGWNSKRNHFVANQQEKKNTIEINGSSSSSKKRTKIVQQSHNNDNN